MAVEHIMVVDDSATDRYYLSNLLENDGYEVTAVDSGEACLREVLKGQPDLIICDVVMPGMSGFEVVRTLSQNPKTNSVPVILCTGKSIETDAIWAQKMGAITCIIKPVDEDELLNLLDEMA